MTTNSLLASCLTSAAVDKEPTPLWSATVQTRSADLDNVWRVVDEHESVLHTSKSPVALFHQHRQLVVKHLPRDVTEHVSFFPFFSSPEKNGRPLSSSAHRRQPTNEERGRHFGVDFNPSTTLRVDVPVKRWR